MLGLGEIFEVGSVVLRLLPERRSEPAIWPTRPTTTRLGPQCTRRTRRLVCADLSRDARRVLVRRARRRSGYGACCSARPASARKSSPSARSPALATSGAVLAAQLRRAARDADRERAVRPREGRVHRRRPAASRVARSAARRHAVPRRDWRAAAHGAGEAPARAREPSVHARRWARQRCSSTCASSRRPIAALDGEVARAASARTSSSASTASPSACRRCASRPSRSRRSRSCSLARLAGSGTAARRRARGRGR